MTTTKNAPISAMPQVRFNIERELHSALADLARRHDRTPTAEARHALRCWIAEHTNNDDDPGAA